MNVGGLWLNFVRASLSHTGQIEYFQVQVLWDKLKEWSSVHELKSYKKDWRYIRLQQMYCWPGQYKK